MVRFVGDKLHTLHGESSEMNMSRNVATKNSDSKI